MARQCYRGGCAEVATASCLFDPWASLAWLFPADEETETHAQAFLLCLDHADSLEVPVGWVLHDMREQTEAADGGTGGAAADGTGDGTSGGADGWTDDAADGGAGGAADGETSGGTYSQANPTETGAGAEADNVIPIKGADQQEHQQDQQSLVIEDDMPLLQRAFRTVAPH